METLIIKQDPFCTSCINSSENLVHLFDIVQKVKMFWKILTVIDAYEVNHLADNNNNKKTILLVSR